MCALLCSSFLLFMSLGLMAFAIIHNQIEATYASALAIPFFNVASAICAFLAALLAVVPANQNSDSRLARPVTISSFVATFIFLLLVPIADQGLLSKLN